MPAAHLLTLSLYFFDVRAVQYEMCTKCCYCMAVWLCVLSVRFKQKLNCVSNACACAYAYAYVFYFRIYVGGGSLPLVGVASAPVRCGGGGSKQKIKDR